MFEESHPGIYGLRIVRPILEAMNPIRRVLIYKPLPSGIWQRLWWMVAPPREAYHFSDDHLRLVYADREVVLKGMDLTGAEARGRDIHLTHPDGGFVLRSLDDAEALASVLRQWMHALQAKPPQPASSLPPIDLQNDRLNDLTFLWSQGLVSEADYEAERRKFS